MSAGTQSSHNLAGSSWGAAPNWDRHSMCGASTGYIGKRSVLTSEIGVLLGDRVIRLRQRRNSRTLMLKPCAISVGQGPQCTLHVRRHPKFAQPRWIELGSGTELGSPFHVWSFDRIHREEVGPYI